DSGPATTTNANDVLVAGNLVQTGSGAAGSGWTRRLLTVPDSDVLQDRIVTAIGTYDATNVIGSGRWIMQMVAFKAAGTGGDTQAPTAPTGLTPAVQSATAINVSWTASTDNVGVTGYRIERCQGVGCSTFAQVGTSATTSYADSGLSSATSYSYRVSAVDA